MFKRKIDDTLRKWKADPNKKPLMIKGMKRCGKTYSVLKFAEKCYKRVIYLNFSDHPEYRFIFSSSLDPDYIISMISSTLTDPAPIKPEGTILIFDDAQFCPRARTSLKPFKEDGRYDVICIGSTFSMTYGKEYASVPVGYEWIVEMGPMDFEEFLWANGVKDTEIDTLKKSLRFETPVPYSLHKKMRGLLQAYAVVGGMPEAVSAYLDAGPEAALASQRDVLTANEEDMDSCVSKSEGKRIAKCLDSIPAQLEKPNKKFQYALIEKGARASAYFDSIIELEDAGLAARCFNLETLELPLGGNEIQDVFKLFYTDVGLFASTLDDEDRKEILSGNLDGLNGAILESLVADIFSKMGKKLHYFRRSSGLSIDFAMRYKGGCHIVETKKTNRNSKSARTVLGDKERYRVDGLIRLRPDLNVKREGETLTLPAYMAFLLTEI